MLAVVVHDLRSPLQVVKMAAEMLVEGALPPDTIRDLGRRMRHSIDSMVYLMDDLLDLSAVESGELKLDLKEHDLSEVVEKAVSVARLSAAANSITVEHVPDPSGLRVLVDPRRMEQVLTNLLDNAVRHTGPETTVTVRANATPDFAELRVSDRGPGVPKNLRDRIFEPYRQGSKKGRSGLGLAISRRIMDGHGGTLTYEPRPGGGATFICRFRTSDAHRAGQPHTSANGH